MKKRRILTLWPSLLLALCLCAGCGGTGADNTAEPTVTGPETTQEGSNMNPIATITMQDGTVISIELYPDIAPNTCNNFISLANQGYYDGTIFHRIIADFMIQGGDPDGTGYGGPGYTIVGEFSDNGYTNNLSHTPGVLSMARTNQGYDTAGSQFFIVVGDATFLDGKYAAFGKTLDDDSLAACIKLSKVETSSSDLPLEQQVIKTIRVDTKGVTYPEPETIR